MILYHFTASELLESIMREGLSRGDVPTNVTGGTKAVWFTTSRDGTGHGLGEPRLLTDEERASLLRIKGGALFSGDIWFLDKRAVRIEVRIPSSDRALRRWLPWAKKHVEPRFLEALIETGGGKRKAETWYLYFGTIEPSRFALVEVNGKPYVLEAEAA